MVTSSSQRHDAFQAIVMRVREADGVVAAGTVRPHADARVVDFRLLVDPVEQGGPLALGGGRVARVRG